MHKILILVTNHATLGETDEKNGTFALEITHAVDEFVEAGFDYDIASIKGGVAPLYGEEDEDAINQKVLASEDFKNRIQNTMRASQVNPEDYAAVFYPGGFGLLSDLAKDASCAQISAKIYEAGKVVGAVCHGPAGLLPITLSDGTKLLADKQVTAFTREEEVEANTIEKIPFLLEESMTRQSGKFTKVAPWAEHVIVDERLVTGQNPASAQGVGRAMVELIQSSE